MPKITRYLHQQTAPHARRAGGCRSLWPLDRIAAAVETERTEWCGNTNSARGRAAQLNELCSSVAGAYLSPSRPHAQAHCRNASTTAPSSWLPSRAASRPRPEAAAAQLLLMQQGSTSEPAVWPETTFCSRGDSLSCRLHEAGCRAGERPSRPAGSTIDPATWHVLDSTAICRLTSRAMPKVKLQTGPSVVATARRP